MKKAIARFLVTAVCVIIVSYLLPGIHVKDSIAAILVAAVLGFLNMFLRPLLLIFTIPVTLVTFGLFLFVINGIIVWLTGKIIPGHFGVDSFLWAILFSIVLSLVNSLLEGILGLGRENDSE